MSSPSSPSSTPAWAPLVLVGILAAALGALITWALLPSPPMVVPPAVSSAPALPNGATVPPDVSQLAPGAAAVALGNWHYDHNEWAAAIGHYQKALTLGMDTPDVHTDLGNAYRFNGDPQNALRQYTIARRQNPMHENSLINTAGLYGEVLHDDANAARTWREFLRRFPDSLAAPRARQALSEIETRSGPSPSLEEQLKAAAK